MLIAQHTFDEFKRDCCSAFGAELIKSKQVNGSSIAAHIKAAVAQDIAAGMTVDDANKKWGIVREEDNQLDPAIVYVINLYYKLITARTYGMEGINPLSLHDIAVFERRYGSISEPILSILFSLDEIYYNNK